MRLEMDVWLRQVRGGLPTAASLQNYDRCLLSDEESVLGSD